MEATLDLSKSLASNRFEFILILLVGRLIATPKASVPLFSEEVGLMGPRFPRSVKAGSFESVAFQGAFF
jgi:hypothetical protein